MSAPRTFGWILVALALSSCARSGSAYAECFGRFVEASRAAVSNEDPKPAARLERELLARPDVDYLWSQTKDYGRPERQIAALYLLKKAVRADELASHLPEIVENSGREVSLTALGVAVEASSKGPEIVRSVVEKDRRSWMVSGAVGLAKRMSGEDRSRVRAALLKRFQNDKRSFRSEELRLIAARAVRAGILTKEEVRRLGI